MSAARDLDPSASVLAFFGTELRRLRAGAGLSQEELGRRVSCSASLIGMVETARRAPTRDFAARCDEALASGGSLSRLWPLVSREALPGWFRPFAEIERGATSIRIWEPLVVPGLLQTEEYARALITAWQPADGHEAVQRQVAARMERQQLLERPDPPLTWMIIGEAALRNPVGGAQVLAVQLRHVLDVMSSHPRLIVQIIPIGAGAHPGLEGPMALAGRGGQPDIAYLEVQGRGQVVESADEAGRYGLVFDLLRAVALPPEASRDMIAGLAKGEQL